ncbi:hypothetical protein EYD10_16703 [Varanus komodoensis]|uniref:Coiled-coil domain containing 103 n=1 Tax=Varanus komodoensis TaxID=61221 RepID=A0A8D2Q748_VARKO|nr:coiled-coil domain-containing protein 103 [Varanus komodoensis]KAF7236575.1 hypothetical protein EYD10_16703 [Varanus komodoensis]
MDSIIDFHALEKELEEAIATDEKYQRENEAKFRAVHQKVASYEEFRDIVLASHLRPLEKRDKVREKRNVSWNTCTTKADCKLETEVQLSPDLDLLPKTSSEFYRDWRRCMKNSQERYQFLMHLGSQTLCQLFQTDLAFGLLGEFLAVLAENACNKDQDLILEILESFSRTKRFGLNVELLGKQEKEVCRQLFDKLRRMGTSPNNPSDLSYASDAAGTAITQMDDQANGPVERRLKKLMHLYQVS